MPGNIQPQRYTYFLTQDSSTYLQQLADHQINKTWLALREGQAATNGKPAPQAMTCLSSIVQWYRIQMLYVVCGADNGVIFETYKAWPSKNVAKSVCQVGEKDCPSYLGLDSDKWDGPSNDPAPSNNNSDKNTSTTVDDCVKRKSEDLRKEIGPDAPINYDQIMEWEKECK